MLACMVGPRGTDRGSKSLVDAANERVRAATRAYVRDRHGNNASAAARELGVSQPMLSEFMAGTRGAGPRLLNAIADATGYSLDYLHGRTDSPTGIIGERFLDHPDWARVAAEARRRFPLAVPPYAYDGAGRFARERRAVALTAEVALQLAQAWLATASEDELAAATTAWARADAVATALADNDPAAKVSGG
jgi:transcriptional regulator with XRE-family HTH domain